MSRFECIPARSRGSNSPLCEFGVVWRTPQAPLSTYLVLNLSGRIRFLQVEGILDSELVRGMYRTCRIYSQFEKQKIDQVAADLRQESDRQEFAELWYAWLSGTANSLRGVVVPMG